MYEKGDGRERGGSGRRGKQKGELQRYFHSASELFLRYWATGKGRILDIGWFRPQPFIPFVFIRTRVHQPISTCAGLQRSLWSEWCLRGEIPSTPVIRPQQIPLLRVGWEWSGGWRWGWGKRRLAVWLWKFPLQWKGHWWSDLLKIQKSIYFYFPPVRWRYATKQTEKLMKCRNIHVHD